MRGPVADVSMDRADELVAATRAELVKEMKRLFARLRAQEANVYNAGETNEH